MMVTLMNKITQSSCLSILVSIVLIAPSPCLAQKGAFDPDEGVRQAGMATPSPIDKMMALNQLLGKKVNWKEVAKAYKRYMDVDDFADKNVMLPVLMGMRMSDGVIAIQARDIEVLNATSSDIESMAEKLGVDGGQLLRAKKVRSYANKNKWNRVFLELGYLQKDVMDTMSKEGNSDRRAILIAAGWIQGARIVSSVVKANYSEDTSGLLREPLLVKQMIKDIENLKGEKRNDVVIVKMLGVLNKMAEIIDVPLNSGIAEDKVKEIQEITSQFATDVLTNKR